VLPGYRSRQRDDVGRLEDRYGRSGS
jgi:hypothetical protein